MRRSVLALSLAAALASLLAVPAIAGTLCCTVRDRVTLSPVAHAGIFLRTAAGDYTGLYGSTDAAGSFCIAGVPAGTYDVEVLVDDYQVAYLRGVVVTSSGTSVDLNATPAGLRLAVPAPNPARLSTRLAWTLPGPSRVRLSIFDAHGRLVRGWQGEALPAGEHSQQWNLTDASGRTVGAGVYFVHLDTATGRLVRAVVRVP